MPSQLHLLKKRRFLPLFITQFLGAFNDNVFKNSLIIWFTYKVAEQQGLDAGIVVNLAAGLFILPFFLFSATAGQLSDKFEKSSMIRKIKLCEIVLMIACAAGFMLQNIYFLLAILFFMGIQSAFFGPLKYSILPSHLKKEELIGGNAVIEAGTFLSILLGTIFSGLLILTDQGVETIALAVIIISVSGYLSSRFIPLSPPADSSLIVNKNFFAETWNIIKYTKSNESVWLALLGISWFWFIGVTFLTQFTPYTESIIHGNEHIITLFLTIFSIGIALGSLLCNKLLKGAINAKFVPLGCILISLFTSDFFLASQGYNNAYNHLLTLKPEKNSLYPANIASLNIPDFLSLTIHSWRILFDLLMISIASGIYIVPLYAIMQDRADPSHLSRVIAGNNIMNALFMVASSILTIILFSLEASIPQIFLLLALLNGLMFFVIKRLVKLKTPKEHLHVR